MGERSRVGGAVRVGILAGLVGAGLAGVLWRHWEMLGEARRDPRFVRFARRYAGRAAEGVAGLRARALDCRGEEFEPAEEGSEFRRVLDDLAVSAGTSEVELTIDGRLQARAEELLAGRAGAVVAIEPSTGKVRALASSPRSAGLNRALNGLYPPGSVFKVFMAAAAVSAGVEPALECGAGGDAGSSG